MEKNSNKSSNQRKRIPDYFRMSNWPDQRDHFSFIGRLPIILLVGLLFLAACSGGGAEPTASPSPQATSTAHVLATIPPKPTDASPPTPASYPPPTDDSSGASEPPGYPEPPSPEPTLDPYPGGFAIIQIAAGIQCEDPLFPDLASATAALEQAGIKVQKAEEVQLMVCESCDCPTSTHYRVLVHPAELNAALALGWQRGN